MKRLSILLIVYFIGVSSISAQVNVFATAKLDRSSVYPQQPIKASITVYTETWFTKPLDIENIQVANAFVVPFKRTLSAMRQVNGKKYASLEFYYLIFPYQQGSYTFPEIRLNVESPPVGDYKGQSVQVNTKSLPFEVKEQPNAFTGASWFVAIDVSISQKWNKPVNDFKVGDVVERTIQIDAKGTLPNFIPDLIIEEEDYATIYKKSPQLEDKRSTQSANGLKSETFLYLFSEPGKFTIPETRVDWWNPFASKAYFKVLPAQEITVADNPDLGMLATLQDSLSQVQVLDDGQEVKVLSWWEAYWKYFIAAPFFVLILYHLLKFLLKKIKAIEEIREKTKSSEAYAFRQLEKENAKTFERAFIHWWNKFYLVYGLNPSFTHEFQKRGFSNKKDILVLRKFRSLVMTEHVRQNHFSSIQESF